MMDEQELKTFVKTTMSDFTNQSIPWHTHNGVDSSQINSYDINTNNNQGFVFGTAGTTSINIQYIPFPQNTFYIVEGQQNLNAPSLVQFHFGDFKNVDILANGDDSIDAVSLNFRNLPKSSTVSVTATDALMSYTTGVGSNLSKINLTSADANIRVDDGINSSNMELKPGLLHLTVPIGNDFAFQLPVSTLPTPVVGMIAFDGSDFRGVDSSGTWKTFTLV